MAGRKVVAAAAAAAMAVALLAVLVVASEAGDCGVNQGKAVSCLSFCNAYGKQPWATPSAECCKALEHADFKCLCNKYRGELQSGSAYARCATAIPSKCNIWGAPKSC